MAKAGVESANQSRRKGMNCVMADCVAGAYIICARKYFGIFQGIVLNT